jgi:hypothetical protein
MGAKTNIQTMHVSLSNGRRNDGYARYIDHVISCLDKGGITEITTCSGRPAGTHIEWDHDVQKYIAVPN